MEGIQLHNKDEEIVGVVVTANGANFNRICEMWDKYIAEYEGDEDIYQFEELFSNEIFSVLPLDFYQP